MKVYYIGMDVHKKNISYCIKTKSGEIVSQGNIASNRESLRQWVTGLPKRWIGAMEATLFSGWIFELIGAAPIYCPFAAFPMVKPLTFYQITSQAFS
jgi:transposase